MSIRLKARRFVRRSLPSPPSSSNHRRRSRRPWPSAGSRLGVVSGLTAPSEQDRRPLRFRHRAVREHLPPWSPGRRVCSSRLPVDDCRRRHACEQRTRNATPLRSGWWCDLTSHQSLLTPRQRGAKSADFVVEVGGTHHGASDLLAQKFTITPP